MWVWSPASATWSLLDSLSLGFHIWNIGTMGLSVWVVEGFKIVTKAGVSEGTSPLASLAPSSATPSALLLTAKPEVIITVSAGWRWNSSIFVPGLT